MSQMTRGQESQHSGRCADILAIAHRQRHPVCFSGTCAWPSLTCVILLQVAWQSLLDEASEGSVSDDSGTGKASIAGAVLTHRRLLILSATLSVLTAHVPSPAAPATTSFLWLGPALIFCNAAHQVDSQVSDASEPSSTEVLSRPSWQSHQQKSIRRVASKHALPL